MAGFELITGAEWLRISEINRSALAISEWPLSFQIAVGPWLSPGGVERPRLMGDFLEGFGR
jgi:hypothetical protein